MDPVQVDPGGHRLHRLHVDLSYSCLLLLRRIACEANEDRRTDRQIKAGIATLRL